MTRRLPGYIASAVVALILFIFIAFPLGAVLIESFSESGPMALTDLRAMTLDGLDLLEEKERQALVRRWVKAAKPKDRMEVTAATLQLIGSEVTWDRKAVFSQQIEAAGKTVAALDQDRRARFDEQYPIALVMLKKRIPLAFKIRDRLSPQEFTDLRTGENRFFGFKHYLSIFIEPRLQKGLRNSLFIATMTCLLTTLLAYALAFGVNRGAVPLPNLVALRNADAPGVAAGDDRHRGDPDVRAAGAPSPGGCSDETLGWIDADVTNLYGLGGVIVAEVLSFLPAAFIIMDNVLGKHDGRLEEAASSQGAGPWQVFTRVTLPLSMPGLRRTVVLCFILAMTDFGNPLVIGQGIPVLAGILYDEMIGFQNTELSSALAMWMVVPALTGLLPVGEFRPPQALRHRRGFGWTA